MMLMMVIFSVMSAGLFYAARVPVIQDEINVIFSGKTGDSGEDVGRVAHLTFILFTFTSPLLLASALSMIMLFFRWLDRRQF